MSSFVPEIRPASGIIGIPEGLKEAGKRVDFKPNDFDLMIETKGYRLAWSRAVQCPAPPVNEQTDQPDPNCDLCEGAGWLYFAPSEPVSDELVGNLTPLQQSILTRNNAAVIRGVMTNIEQSQDPYNKISAWRDGEMMLTVRAPNQLGYYDKIVNLDSSIIYAEVIDASGTNTQTLRYPASGVNLIRSKTTIYKPEIDWTLDAGDIKWVAGGAQPATDERIVVHYLTHPTWLVMDHPHVIRTTPVKFKTATPRTPQGDPRFLPIQAHIKLDFIP